MAPRLHQDRPNAGLVLPPQYDVVFFNRSICGFMGIPPQITAIDTAGLLCAAKEVRLRIVSAALSSLVGALKQLPE